jgi:outer membrane receptor protein involved in Fe transport
MIPTRSRWPRRDPRSATRASALDAPERGLYGPRFIMATMECPMQEPCEHRGPWLAPSEDRREACHPTPSRRPSGSSGRARGVISPLFSGFLLLTALAPLSVQAADGPGADTLRTYTLPESILVVGTKVPLELRRVALSATVINAERFRNSLDQTPAGVTGTVPGFHVYDFDGTGMQSAVDARGFTSSGRTSYFVVLQDEVPMNDLEADNVDWNLLSLAPIERLEILRGPVSFLYGSSAMSGLVNLVTRRPSPRGRCWGEISGGSADRRTTQVGVDRAGKNWEGLVAERWHDQAGFRSHSRVTLRGLNGQALRRLSARWSLKGSLLMQETDQEVPGPLPADLARSKPESARGWNPNPMDPNHWSAPPVDDRRVQALQPSVVLKGLLGPHLELTTHVRGDLRDVDATETVIPVGALDRLSRTRAAVCEARLQWRSPSPRIRTWMTGAEAGGGRLTSRYFQSTESNGRLKVGAGRVDRTDLGVFTFLQTEPFLASSPSGGLSFSLGARGDRIRSDLTDLARNGGSGGKVTFSAFSPAVGLNYDVPGTGSFFFTAARSFKTPTLEQLYDQRPYVTGVDSGGRPITRHISSGALKPQRGVHTEAGFRSVPLSFCRFDAGAYLARSRDEIGFDLDSLRYANIDRSNHFGLELQAELTAGRFLRANLGYSLDRALFDGGDFDGKQINGVPRDQLHLELNGRLPFRCATTWRWSRIGRQWLDEGNRYPLAPYSLLDIDVVHRISAVEILASIGNVTDERYAPAAYLTSVLDGFDAEGHPIMRDLPLYFPAEGRSFRLGLRLDLEDLSGEKLR